MRQARKLEAGDPRALAALDAALLSERLNRATAAAQAELDGAMDAAGFVADGRQLLLRDLTRTLSNEKSAVKRKALYTAALPAMAQVGGARTRLLALVDQAATADGLTPDAAAELLLGRSLPDAAAEASALLDATDPAFKALLAGFAARELQLPVDKLGRADFPRLLKSATVADRKFSRADVPVRATELLGQLGLYGTPGLTLDLSGSPRKLPLPLTVMPRGPGDVRLSYLPLGGLRDMSGLLDELGRAVAFHGATPRFESARLGSAAWADASGALFASLAWDPVWLAASGLPTEQAGPAADVVHFAHLYAARRAAGELLARWKGRDQPLPDAAELWRTETARALGVPCAPEETARVSFDAQPLYREAEAVHAFVLGEQLRKALSLRGADWWKHPEARALLDRYWAYGSFGGVAPDGLDGGIQGVGPVVTAWRPKAWDRPRESPADAGAPQLHANGRDGGGPGGTLDAGAPPPRPPAVAADGGSTPPDGGAPPGAPATDGGQTA